MKKVLTIILLTAIVYSCKKENINYEKASSKLTIDKLAGYYKGTFLTCGAIECKEVDTTFSIVNRDNKTFLKFGAIEDEIEFFYGSNTICSANITWDSAHVNGKYGISGNFKNDTVQICLGSLYMPDDIYKNNLLGKRN